MEFKIWRHLIQILSYRNDLIDIIKPFLRQLNNNNNNEKHNIQEEKHIPYLKSLSDIHLKLLCKYEIIDEGQFTPYISRKESKYLDPNPNEEKVIEIIKEDKIEEIQRLIREKGIGLISPITTSFKEVEKMIIPIIHYSLIQRAICCFKYLLINGIEDPTKTMKGKIDYLDKNNHGYEWDCLAIAIYFGEAEIIKILEEKGIEKGSLPVHIEAAILSYRNLIVTEIISQMKENVVSIKKDFLNLGLIASAKNNNIIGAEFLINEGVEINAEDIIYHIIEIVFLMNGI